MPAVEAVLFDYGRTLVTFEYPTAGVASVVDRFRPAIATATGAPAPSTAEIVERVLLPLEALVENPGPEEVHYLEVFAAAWRRAGLALPDELLYDILDAEQRVWDRVARVDPEGPQVLGWLREHGYKLALCSNAPFPPEMMLRQVNANGVRDLVDAVVFSSQVGWRKPAPPLYRAALEAIGVDAGRALFVGDRLREDYEGPLAIGMRAVIVAAHAAERPPDGVRTISSLSRLPEVL